jgi:HSP20 family protein
MVTKTQDRFCKKNDFKDLNNTNTSMSIEKLTSIESSAKPLISGEREPLADITTTDNEVKVILEMPGVTKENIRINAYDNSVEVKSDDPQRKYHRVIEIPQEADTETVKSTYKNGVPEIVFKKKEQTKPKGKEVKVE